MFLVQALRGMFFGGSSQLYKKTPEKTRREIDNTIIVTLHAAQIYYEIHTLVMVTYSLNLYLDPARPLLSAGF